MSTARVVNFLGYTFLMMIVGSLILSSVWSRADDSVFVPKETKVAEFRMIGLGRGVIEPERPFVPRETSAADFRMIGLGRGEAEPDRPFVPRETKAVDLKMIGLGRGE